MSQFLVPSIKSESDMWLKWNILVPICSFSYRFTRRFFFSFFFLLWGNRKGNKKWEERIWLHSILLLEEVHEYDLFPFIFVLPQSSNLLLGYVLVRLTSTLVLSYLPISGLNLRNAQSMDHLRGGS